MIVKGTSYDTENVERINGFVRWAPVFGLLGSFNWFRVLGCLQAGPALAQADSLDRCGGITAVAGIFHLLVRPIGFTSFPSRQPGQVEGLAKVKVTVE